MVGGPSPCCRWRRRLGRAHGGATAVFRIGSVREAAQLAEAIAASLASKAQEGADDRRRPPHRPADARHLAARAAARGAGAGRLGGRAEHVAPPPTAQPSRRCSSRSPRSPKRSISPSGAPCSATRRSADDNGVDPLGHGSTVWMQDLPEAKPLRHAMHLDVSVAREHVESRVAAALAAGGRIVGRRSWTHEDARRTAFIAHRPRCRSRSCAWPDRGTADPEVHTR